TGSSTTVEQPIFPARPKLSKTTAFGLVSPFPPAGAATTHPPWRSPPSRAASAPSRQRPS
uniref:Uncharacterized protein n=1 Tax=Aegilops tauschii subsp. strangulata TaxID=200361 RepID=A0A453JBH1_AEGTS